MSDHAKAPRWTRRLQKSPHFITAVALVAIGVPMYLAGPAGAASTFGGFELDGDLFTNGVLDWSNVGGQPVATDPIGGADNSVFSGSKESQPEGWNLKTNAPGKDDIGPVYEFSHIDPATNHQFVYFAFERASNTGTVNFVVELNQKANHLNSHGVSVPTRTTGDMRFNVTQNGNNPGLAAHGADQFDGTNYVPMSPPPLAFDSAVNTTAINPLPGGNDPVANANGGQIPAGQFAEFGFDLTQFIDPNHPCNIPAFDSLNSRSRASDSNTAEVKDFIQPVGLNLPGSCYDLKIQKFKADGTTALPGATFSISPNPTTGTLPALSVTDGSANDPDNTADGVIEFSSAKPLGAGNQYTVTETAAPSGYLLAVPAFQTSTDALSFHSDTLSFTDTLGSVTFTKVDAATSTAQCCAHFQLTNPPGVVNSDTINVVDNGTNDASNTGGTITVNNLRTGTWQVAETQAPVGFGLDAATPQFTIDDANHTRTLTNPTFSDPVAPTIDVGILKTDSPDPVSAGGTLTYTLSVTNNGTNATANTITVSDTIPANLDNPQVTSAVGWTCGISVPPPPPAVLTCTLPAGLAAGASANDITLTGTVNDAALGAPPSTSGSISNTATVAMQGDSVAANNSSTASTSVIAPDLRIIKEANPDPGTVGAALVYTLHVRNIGSGPTTGAAPQITVTDTLNNALTINSASGTGWTCNTVVQTVTCTLPGPLAANTSANDININVTPTQAFAAPGVDNTATVSAGHDPNAANNSSHIQTPINNAPASPDVSYVDSCGPPQSITLNASNIGGTDELLDVTKPDGTHENVNVPAHTPVGAPVTRTYSLTGGNSVSASGPDLVGSPVTHTFALNCAGPPPPPAPGNPVLTLAKSSVPAAGSTVQRGDSITYTLDYANTGNAAATNVVVSDVLPADTTFTSASAGGSYDSASNTVSWTIANLANGTSGSVSFVVQVAQTATDGETLHNVGLVGAAGLNPVQSNPVDLTVSVPVTPPTPTLAIVKKVDRTVAEYGDTLTYTFTVTAGGASQTGVSATDQVPTGTEYVAGSATCSTGCAGSEAGGVVTWAIGNMAQGDTVTLTFRVTINNPTPDANGGVPPETVTNLGTVGSDQVDPLDSNTVRTQVVAVLGISKKPPVTPKPEPSPLPFTGLPYPLLQTVVLSSLMIVAGLWLTRPRRRRPLA